MKKTTLNKNFGYGTGIENNDSNIKKQLLYNINDLQLYLEDLISSQMINATIKNNIIKKQGFGNLQLIVKLK